MSKVIRAVITYNSDVICEGCIFEHFSCEDAKDAMLLAGLPSCGGTLPFEGKGYVYKVTDDQD